MGAGFSTSFRSPSVASSRVRPLRREFTSSLQEYTNMEEVYKRVVNYLVNCQ